VAIRDDAAFSAVRRSLLPATLGRGGMDMMEMMMQALMDQQGMMAGSNSPATAPPRH